MVAMISLLFIMSRDAELPRLFQRLNNFGVPIYPTICAFIFPMTLLLVVHDVAGLADLYAIGFVGAIAVNLGSTSTNLKLPLNYFERAFMFATCLIMSLIELTLFVDKPHARGFVFAVMAVGLLLRSLVKEQIEKVHPVSVKALAQLPEHTEKSMLVAVTAIGKSLDFALQEAQDHNIPLNVLFVREQKVVTDEDKQRSWVDDPVACQVFDYVINKSLKIPVGFLYAISANPAHTIVDIAQERQVRRIVMGMPRKTIPFIRVLRGSIVRDVSRYLPKNIDFVVVY